ncbi:MAG: hypothetical protein IPK19_00695 [Chloroflexi bacterium]|nr:hypothetical protein [Chloroflexota bacterium]
MQFYSFDARDPIVEVGGWKLSFQVITLENIYGLALEDLTLSPAPGGWRLTCKRLSWAGGQERADGSLSADIVSDGAGGLRLTVDAHAPEPITSVKLLIRDLAALQPLDMFDQPRAVPTDGLLDRYPNQLRLPVWLAALGDSSRIGLRCEDPEQRPKRFCAYAERMGPLTGRLAIECIHDEDARHLDTAIRVPAWVLARDAAPDDFRAAQLAFNEAHTGLTPWEGRTDVPGWARDLKLVLTLHGMHWSGAVFNDYARMLEIIRYVAERIDGRQVLAYLPGWEGRYYWQYGDFRPEPRLGGADGFEALCDGARALGVHVMPMFGGNCANSWMPNFHTFGPSSYMKSATRNVFLGNQPDWNLSRAHDTGWQAWLNPGAPAWQNELLRQITRLMDQYGFDSVFLDTVEVFTNDPDFNIREGYRQLVERLRDGRPDLLVTGEDWWDGLVPIFPIFQQTSKWRQVPRWVGRYARLMGHICDGEASRGSTGVFESGYAAYERLPDEPHYLPTLAFVDGTLEAAQEEIDAVIALARGKNNT